MDYPGYALVYTHCLPCMKSRDSIRWGKFIDYETLVMRKCQCIQGSFNRKVYVHTYAMYMQL